MRFTMIAVAVLSLLAAARALTGAADVIAVEDTLAAAQHHTVSSSSDALDVAMRITGFEHGFNATLLDSGTLASPAFVESLHVPFLTDTIAGHSIWRVTFGDVYVRLPIVVPKPMPPGTQIPKIYDVYIDSVTGCIVKIQSRYDDTNDTTIAKDPPLHIAEYQMARSGLKYLGFVHDSPAVPFYRALDSARPSSPVHAKQIIAFLVYVDVRGERRPVWSIYGRGTPPIHGSGLGGNKPPSSNRVWTLVDAITGEKLFFATNVTFPVDSTGR